MRLQNQTRQRSAFTTVELVVVIVVLTVLAAMVLPALAGSRSNTRAVQCMINLRRLTTAWQMYASDNSDRMATNAGSLTSGWVAGWMDWSSSSDNTNTLKLLDPLQSLIARYVRSAELFKCPADIYKSPVQSAPRARSVSMNAALGGNPTINNQIPGRIYFAARKLAELNKPGPASTIAILDEHPDSINDGTFIVSEGLAPAGAQWVDLPASYHDAGAGISFADGHAVIKRWQDARTIRPVTFSFTGNLAVPNSVDYAWVNDRLPYR